MYMAEYIKNLQGTIATATIAAAPSGSITRPVKTLDELGKEIVGCCEGRDLPEVSLCYTLLFLVLKLDMSSIDLDISTNRCRTSTHESYGHAH